ncbi:type II toxin-antitoxin system HicB family antitoxin [Nitrosopumilus ureiphilus]|nr:type II toxin-antitoxin system HicB family antitoxin [Nitrosopumilus ureiphilus]
MNNMETRKFTIQVIKSSEGGYTGRCLELPAAISEGDTLEELEANMKEVVSLILESIEEKTKPDQKIIIEITN